MVRLFTLFFLGVSVLERVGYTRISKVKYFLCVYVKAQYRWDPSYLLWKDQYLKIISQMVN